MIMMIAVKKNITYKYMALACFLFVFSGLSAQDDPANLYNESGQKAGSWIFHYDNGQPEKAGEFKNGEKHGIWTGWYANGNIRYEITYENGSARGPARMYYSDGTLREEGNWQELFWVGEYRFFHPNGQLFYEWSYNNSGRREGEQRYFYANGNKMYLGEWMNGSISGHVEVYDSTGMMVQVRNYEGGKFASSSEVNVTTPAESGMVPFKGTGFHTIYRMSGEVYRRGYFRQGELKKGEEYVYDDDHVLRQIRVYEAGRVVNIKSGTELDRVLER